MTRSTKGRFSTGRVTLGSNEYPCWFVTELTGRGTSEIRCLVFSIVALKRSAYWTGAQAVFSIKFLIYVISQFSIFSLSCHSLLSPYIFLSTTPLFSFHFYFVFAGFYEIHCLLFT